MAHLATPRLYALQLLLAPELLSIALRVGPARSELDTIDIMFGLIATELYNVTRACAAT